MMKKAKPEEALATTEQSPTVGTSAMTWSDWFDHWPETFARRWPETLRNLPFGAEMIRIEQFNDQDGALVVRAEMPGIDPESDVTISIDDGLMTVTGEREERRQTDGSNGYRTEFQYGSFSRTVRLPVGARPDDVVATYHDGILEVRVPVDADKPTVRKVPITI